MRISDDIESIIESVEPTIDHIIDQELEFDSVVEAAASLDVVDPVDIANDDEINEIVNTAIGAGLITDNDVDDIASGKISISDEVDEEAEKADKEIEEYADDAIRDGILAREEVEAILNGIPVMEALDIDFDEDQDSFDEEELVCIAGDDESFNESIAEKLGIKKPADEKSRAKALNILSKKVIDAVRTVFKKEKGEVVPKLTKEDERRFIKDGKSVKLCEFHFKEFVQNRKVGDRSKGYGLGYQPGAGVYMRDKDLEDFKVLFDYVGDKLKDDALKFGCRIYHSHIKDFKTMVAKRKVHSIMSWYIEPRKYFFESEESELDMANAALTFDTGINFNESEDDIDAIFGFDEESTPQPTQSGKEVASKPQAGQTDKAQAGETNQKPPVPGTPKQEEDEDLVDRDDNAIDMEVDDAPTFEGDRKAYHDDDDSDDELEERITIDSDDDDDDHEDDRDDEDHDDDDDHEDSDDDDDDSDDDDHDEDDSDDDDDDKGVFKMDESMKLNFVEQAQEVCQEMDLNKVDTMNTFDGAGINADDVEFGYKGPQVGADEKNFDDSFKKEDTVPDNIFKDSFWDYDLDPSIEDMEIGK